MIRLVCIDVDGTLVGTAGKVLPEVWRAAERAAAAGIALAICTGRPGFGTTRELAVRLSPRGWHIFQNGASVVDLESGRSLSAAIPRSTIEMLIERSRRIGRLLEIYSDGDYAVEDDCPMSRAHAELLGVPFRTRALDSFHLPIVRAQWLVHADELETVFAEPHDGLEMSHSTSPVMPGVQFVNMTPAGHDKASAVRTLTQAYGIALDDVMFVGDGENDAIAMRVVGTPIAMGNADPGARAAAKRVVASVDDGGLVEALDLALAGQSRE